MTSTRLSPTAGLFNALVRLLNSRYQARIHELEAAIVAEQAHNRTDWTIEELRAS